MSSTREVSKALFGNADRLEVAHYIASSSDGLIYATEISASLRIPQNRARAQIMAFADAGLLKALPRNQDRRAFYARENEECWKAMRQLCESLSTTSVR